MDEKGMRLLCNALSRNTVLEQLTAWGKTQHSQNEMWRGGPTC